MIFQLVCPDPKGSKLKNQPVPEAYRQILRTTIRFYQKFDGRKVLSILVFYKQS
jgi:hypothetical protein